MMSLNNTFKIKTIVLVLYATLFVSYACSQDTDRIDVLKHYHYQAPPVLKASMRNTVGITGFYIAEKEISKSNNALENTRILQSVLDKNDKVLLPNFTVNITKSGLKLKSNQQLVFQENSVLKIESNNLSSYELLKVHGISNVKIYNAKLIGDRKTHKGTKGEAGHGVSILGSSNVVLDGFDIRDFWGDGIFIGRLNKTTNNNVSITNGIVDNNRRNGLSVVSVQGLKINNLTAANSNGTMPMFGVDIEPHFWVDQIRNVDIENLKTYNNANGGLMIYIDKLRKGGNKDVSINIENYSDFNSYYGISLGRITKEFAGLKGFLSMNNIKLENNMVPVKVRDNAITTFDINIKSFEVINPRNKNAHTNEVKRVFRARKNINVQ